MSVELERKVDLGLDRLDELFGTIRSEQSRHILYAYRISARVGDTLGVFYIILICKYGSRGVADSYLSVGSLFFCGFYSGAEVLYIIKRVEDADDIDAVGDRTLNEIIEHVVGIMAVAQHVLAAEKHLELGLFAVVADGAEPLPRVLVEESQTTVKGSAAPALERIVAYLVHLVEYGEHLFGRHAGGYEGLVSVAQGGLGH